MSVIRELRVGSGLTRRELAAVAGCSYNAIYAAERTLPLKPHEAIMQVLQQLGHDRLCVLGRYAAERRELGEAVLNQLREQALCRSDVVLGNDKVLEFEAR